jgi:hypothetical protein
MAMAFVVFMAFARGIVIQTVTTWLKEQHLHETRLQEENMHRCNINAVRNGVCISHVAKHLCIIKECNQAMFQEKKCRFHYSCSLCNSVFDWDPTGAR